MIHKTIWITGASSGLGETLALAYAKEGVKLILSALYLEKLQPIAQQCIEAGAEVFCLAFDISIKEQVTLAAEKVLAKYKTIDLLINNAGIGQRSLAIETSNEVENQIIDTNFWSAVWLTKAVLPSMILNKQGHIAVVSSISGLFSFPNRSAYSASKHALMGYFESLSIELAKSNICVTLICPGRMNNDFSLEALTAKGEKYGKMDASHTNGVPLNDACKMILNAIKRKKRYLVFGKKEIFLWYIKRFHAEWFYKVASRISPGS